VCVCRSKVSKFNKSNHITHVLHHDPGDGGDGVDVVFGVFGVIGEMDAGYEVKVFEDGVQALTDTGVEIAKRGIGVDE